MTRTRTTLDWLAELDLGAWILGIGSFLFGLACLLQRDFAIYWQPVPIGVPFRQELAYASAVLHMVSGLALLHRRTARLAAQVIIVLYLISGPFASRHDKISGGSEHPSSWRWPS